MANFTARVKYPLPGALLPRACRLFSVALLAFFLAAGSAGNAWANPKYAAIVIDADTGSVLHEASADATRHPASLTKMMTLYMTFDALKRGQLGLREKLRVSKRAAGMPQTNIALRYGDRITVEDAIKSLVVRSANDSAVVLAEALGKTEWQFAVAMTNKARRLGMKRTVFRNASGLPDVRQITTARDMAKLSLALRRDFPQYYHYFKTRQFTYKGRTYKTHNHVLVEYPGADRLKTGYINMSGFNVATSVKRNGYSLVAVVMGGRTAKRRDNHMKNLLSRSLRQVAEMRRPVERNQFANRAVPVPVFKPGTAMNESYDTAPQQQAARVAVGDSLSIGGEDMNWGIQVGAFTESRDAFMAAVNAMNLANRELEGSEIRVSNPEDSSDRIYRARIAGVTQEQARRACRVLMARKESCFVFRNDAQESL